MGPSQVGDTTVVVHVAVYIQEVRFLPRFILNSEEEPLRTSRFTLNQSGFKSAEGSLKPVLSLDVLIKSQQKADDPVEHQAGPMAQKQIAKC